MFEVFSNLCNWFYDCCLWVSKLSHSVCPSLTNLRALCWSWSSCQFHHSSDEYNTIHSIPVEVKRTLCRDLFQVTKTWGKSWILFSQSFLTWLEQSTWPDKSIWTFLPASIANKPRFWTDIKPEYCFSKRSLFASFLSVWFFWVFFCCFFFCCFCFFCFFF